MKAEILQQYQLLKEQKEKQEKENRELFIKTTAQNLLNFMNNIEVKRDFVEGETVQFGQEEPIAMTELLDDLGYQFVDEKRADDADKKEEKL